MLRRTTRMLSLLTLAGAIALPGAALAGPPTDEDVENAVRTYREAMAERPRGEPLTQAQRDEIIREALGDISIDSLTAGQIAQLQRAYMLYSGDLADRALERLDALARDESADGALAAMTRLGFIHNVDDPARQTELFRAALNHPAAMDTVRSGDAGRTLAQARRLPPEVLGSAKEELVRFIERLPDDLTPQTAAQSSTLFDVVTAAAEDDRDAVNRARRSLLRIVNGALEQAEGSPLAARLESTAAYLDGAYARGELVGHKSPQLTFLWSNMEGSPETIADLRGNVVVLDFWATWCGPCIASFPQVRQLTAHYEGYPVVILGVTSLQGRHITQQRERIDTSDDPNLEFSLMEEFIEQYDMTWPVAFTEQNVFNPDFGVRGIPHVAILDPSGVVRHRGLHPSATPRDTKIEMIDALLKEAGLPTPQR